MKYYVLILLSAFTLSACISVNNKGKEEHIAGTEYIQTKEFAKLDLPFSQAVRYGNLLFLSGQIGDDEETGKLVEGGIVPETNQAMKNIKKVLEKNGSSLDHVIKCTCMLADINDWSEMSEEYIKFFPNHKPARSAFAATGLALNARVEIECIAYVED